MSNEPEQPDSPKKADTPKKPVVQWSYCNRPGCYEKFIATSNPQKYCGPRCEQAMEQVLARERSHRNRVCQRKLKRKDS